MADVRTYSKLFIIECIELYQSLQWLWRIGPKEYCDQNKKNILSEIVEQLIWDVYSPSFSLANNGTCNNNNSSVRHIASVDVGFNPSTQRHCRRLIYYLYIHSYMFWSYETCKHAEKYITTLGLLNWQRIRCFIRSHITVIVFIMLLIVDTPLLWATFCIY
jgi:hypothetical protein